ncbi:MAG: hypothetical protein Q4G18_13425 [Myroides sp.]|nr:hypothetical protein [Myroides sp.]
MKKIIFLFSLVLAFASCSKDDEEASTINIEVTKNGVAVANEKVYLFINEINAGSPLFIPDGAEKTVVTGSNGIASFAIDALDLEVIDSQTTFNFAVFGTNNQVLGRTSVTVKKGETKTGRITLN